MNVKERIIPTHFIEVYESIFTQHIGIIKPIKDLDFELESTEKYGYQTLFIWKIKLKKL